MEVRVPNLRRLWSDFWPVLLVLVPGMLGTRPAGEDQPGTREPDIFAFGLVVVAAASVFVQRRRPGVTLVVCGAAVTAYLLANYPYGPMLIAVPVAAYGTAEAWRLRRAVIWNTALGLVVFAVGLARIDDGLTVARGPEELSWLAVSAAAVVAPTAIGAAMRIRRESAAGVRAEQARRAVSEERLRMAQELHDTVGHGLAVIAMQAGVALHVLERNPERVREALEAIRTTSRESLDGLRAELEVLRTPVGEFARRRPALGLADVDILLDRVRGGGVEVHADITKVALPPEVDVAVYRILQESLTNVLRHAGASTVWVSARHEGDDILVRVADDGTGAETPTAAEDGRGSGIPGMRARASALGGEIDAGPEPGGGFAVRARLPLGSALDRSSMPGSSV